MSADPIIPDSEAVKELLRAEMWRRGNLSHLLDPNQRGIRDQFYGSKGSHFVIEAARQLGKSHLLCVLAFEACLRKSRVRVNYATTTAVAAKQITLPIMISLSEQAPEDCRPVWHAAEGQWVFPNKSRIVLFGVETMQMAERARGPRIELNIVDEAGFVPILKHVVESILDPQTLRTKGKLILSSTPPNSPKHYFCKLADTAKRFGSYVHRTIWQSGWQTHDEVRRYIEQKAAEHGLSVEEFMETSFFKREYLASRETEDTLLIVPEFKRKKETVVEERVRPERFFSYVSMDAGFHDFTAVLFGYHDFTADKLVVEHELILQRPNTAQIADGIKEILKLYPDKPRLMVADPFGLLIPDLRTQHQLGFVPAQKDDAENALNVMRMKIGAGWVRIHPRCKTLIDQLEFAIHDGNGGFKRSEEEGHFDAGDALKYLVRHVDQARRANPFPEVPNSFDPRGFGRPKTKATFQDVFLGGTNLGRGRR